MDLSKIHPAVWWLLGGVVLVAIIFRVRRAMADRGTSLIRSPLPSPTPVPAAGGRQTDPERAAFALLQAQAKHALERKADELERRKRDAARDITADFLAESAAEMQRPFDPPGETGGSHSGK